MLDIYEVLENEPGELSSGIPTPGIADRAGGLNRSRIWTTTTDEILGSLDLAKRRLQSEDPKVHRLLDNAIQGATCGASLTQRMLAFARKQDLKPVVVDVPELVRGMAALLKFDPGIVVETHFPLELPKVKVDANQLLMPGLGFLSKTKISGSILSSDKYCCPNSLPLLLEPDGVPSA